MSEATEYAEGLNVRTWSRLDWSAACDECGSHGCRKRGALDHLGRLGDADLNCHQRPALVLKVKAPA